MAEATVTEQKLKYLEYINRENETRHQTSEEDNYPYELLKAGDLQAVEEVEKLHWSNHLGHLSDDPVRNVKYLFVVAATLASRAAISGGMSTERAYTISDLYIQRMDLLKTEGEIIDLRREMIAFYTREVAGLVRRQTYSKAVARCVDYIYLHLHTRIRVADLAEEVGLNATYLSTLFKKETGVAISEFVALRRMEAAGNMLRFSDYSIAEISQILAYSSQSHFDRVFKDAMGMTPLQYRRRYAGKVESWEGGTTPGRM